jgi:hypothetical protein
LILLLVPGILPGLHSKPVLDLGATGSSEINPLVAVSSSLKLRDPIQLFSVHVAQQNGLYWRWLALDHFDGDKWTVGDIDVARGTNLGSNANFDLQPLPRGTDSSVVSATVTITHTPADTGWLPLPYQPFDVSTPGTGIRYDPRHTALAADQPLQPGFSYQVDSRVMLPDYDQLDQRFDYSNPRFKRDTQLPALPPQISQLARTIVRRAGARTPLEDALAIQAYLTDPLVFHYDASVPAGAGDDALQEFLFTSHLGFCQQFASAMAVLMRSLGIPARIAVGFTPGTYDTGAQAYEVTTENAHSWVEVQFPGYGWVPFEPTPARANPVTDHIVFSKPAVTVPLPKHCRSRDDLVRGGCGNRGGGGDTTGGGTVPIGKDPRNEPRLQPVNGKPLGPIDIPLPPEHHGQPLSWRVKVLFVLLATVVLVLVLFPFVKIGVRRWRVMRARNERERALASFRLFESRANDLGLGRQPGETPWEYRSRISSEVRLSDGHLDRLAKVASAAAYSPHEVAEADAEGAGRDGRVAIRDVRRSVGISRRFTGLWRPQI